MANSGNGANAPTPGPGNQKDIPTSYSGGTAPVKPMGATATGTDYGMNPNARGK